MALLLGILAALGVATIISSWINRAGGISTNSFVSYAPLTNANWYVFGWTGSTTSYRYSTDTSSWTTGTLPTAGLWGPSAYNGTRIVLFQKGNAANTALTSTNGTTWTSFTIGTNPTVQTAYYDGTRFIVTNSAGSSISWSLDGITSWTAQVVASSHGVAYDGTSRHIISRTGSTTTAYTSTTGITGTWSTVTLPASDTWQQVLYAAGYWVVVASGGNISYSTNGTTWTANATTSNVNTWVYANGYWYSFTSGASASGRYRVTPDATSTSFNLGSASGSPNSAAFADNKIVVATSGTDLWVGV